MSSTIVSCPNCNNGMTVTPELAGRHVRCPHCRQPMLVPAAGPTSGQLPPVRNSGTAAAPAPRLPAGQVPSAARMPQHGSAPRPGQPAPAGGDEQPYRRRRGPSVGAIIGLVALLLAIPVISCGGLLIIGVIKPAVERAGDVAKESQQRAQEREHARKMAQQALSGRGFAMSGNSVAEGSVDAGSFVVTGTAVGNGGSHPFRCEFSVTRVGRTNTWKLLAVYINGEAVYQAVDL